MTEEIQSLRAEVREQFTSVREELKELTKALRELARLDGQVLRQNDALMRIGKQVDAHEKRVHTIEAVRLPAIELAVGIGNTRHDGENKMNRWLLSLIIGAASSLLTGLIIYFLTR